MDPKKRPDLQDNDKRHTMYSKLFRWSETKNAELGREGRPTFEFFIEAYAANDIYFEGENKNHPGQGIFVFILNCYTHVVAFEDRGDHYFLRTLYPSRKWQARYEKEQNEKE